jgi:hypothetical protein
MHYASQAAQGEVSDARAPRIRRSTRPGHEDEEFAPVPRMAEGTTVLTVTAGKAASDITRGDGYEPIAGDVGELDAILEQDPRAKRTLMPRMQLEVD